MTFYVGQKVVCVDDRKRFDRFNDPREITPVKGTVYTVREIVPSNQFSFGVLLLEIVNEPIQYLEGYGEMYFNPRRFRPAVSPKTDISIFEKILDRAVKGESVDA